MICPKCNGNKEIHTPIYTQGNPFMPSGWEYRICEYCHGTGEIEQTEEEWLCRLSTEEKATWIAAIIDEMGTFPDYLYSSIESKKRYWAKWLKQPHEE